MSRNLLDEFIQTYIKYQQYPTQFNNEEIQLAIMGLCEIDYFNQLRNKIGYGNMATLCTHMRIKFYKKGVVLYKYTVNLEIVHQLIKGTIEELSFRFEEQKRLKNIEMKCLTDCYFATFDCFQFVNTIESNNEENMRKFSNTVMLFNISRGNRCNFFIDKLYYIYQPRHYKKRDYVYKENSPIDGIYFIIKGEFLISKSKTIANEESKIEMINNDLRLLKQENHFYNYCLSRGISLKDKIIQTVGNEMKSQRNNLEHKKTALISHGGLTKINERDIIGDFEYEQKSNERMFSVQCITDKGFLWYISYEQLNLICNKDIKNSICNYARSKGELINRKYNTDILSSTIRNQNTLSPDVVDKNTVDNIINRDSNQKHRFTHSNDINWKTKTITINKSTISKKMSSNIRINTISTQRNLTTSFKFDIPPKLNNKTIATSRNKHKNDIPRLNTNPSTNDRISMTFKEMITTQDSFHINTITNKASNAFKAHKMQISKKCFSPGYFQSGIFKTRCFSNPHNLICL